MCVPIYLKDPRRKRDVPSWRLGADSHWSVPVMQPTNPGALLLMLSLSPGLLSGIQAPCITSSSREQQVFLEVEDWNLLSQNRPWKVLHLGNSPRGGSGSMQSGSPFLSLFSIFGTNWNVFWKVSDVCWSQPGPSTFSSGRKGSLFWIQWTGSKSVLSACYWNPGPEGTLGSRVSQCHLLGCAVAAGSSTDQILGPSGVYLMFFGEVAQEAFKNGCLRERQWRCKAGSREFAGEIDNTFSILVNSLGPSSKSSLGRNQTFSLLIGIICL